MLPRREALTRALALAGLAGLAPACAAPGAETPAGPAGPDQEPESLDWRLVRLGDEPVATGPGQREASLHLDARTGRASGSGGCNRFTGAFRRQGGRLTLGPLAATRMACLDPAAGRTETRFLAALEATAAYRVAGRRLTLLDAAGAPLAVLEEATKR